MGGVLLDSSAYSAFGRGHPGIADRIRSADPVVLSPVVLGELLSGFRRGRRRVENERNLRGFLDSPRVFVAEMSEDTALRFAEIHCSLLDAGTPIPTNELWIAATAMEFGLILLTTDERFARVRQILVERLPPH